MKAARMTAVGRPLEIQDIPTPKIRKGNEKDDNQAIVKVKACGICGTDLHHLSGTAKVGRLPITLGHEISGVVTDVGGAVSSGRMAVPMFKEGDHVVVDNVIFCGQCRACLRGRYNFCHNALMFGRDVDGGLAEYVKVPARNLIRLPENVSFPEGAVLGCAVATAYHALVMGDVRPGDNLVVWGTGGVGLSLVQLAREISGAYPIISVDRKDDRLQLASELGADFTINADKEDPVARIREITKGDGADIVYDAAGVKDVESNGELKTLASLCSGGELIVIATYDAPVTVEPHDELGIFEKKFTGSCGNLPEEIEYLTELISGKRRLDLRKLITQMIDLEQVNDVIAEWKEGKTLVIRPVVCF